MDLDAERYNYSPLNRVMSSSLITFVLGDGPLQYIVVFVLGG